MSPRKPKQPEVSNTWNNKFSLSTVILTGIRSTPTVVVVLSEKYPCVYLRISELLPTPASPNTTTLNEFFPLRNDIFPEEKPKL